ncbi:MAG: OmpA family protein [Hyphomonadaceae bacterium]
MRLGDAASSPQADQGSPHPAASLHATHQDPFRIRAEREARKRAEQAAKRFGRTTMDPFSANQAAPDPFRTRANARTRPDPFAAVAVSAAEAEAVAPLHDLDPVLGVPTEPEQAASFEPPVEQQAEAPIEPAPEVREAETPSAQAAPDMVPEVEDLTAEAVAGDVAAGDAAAETEVSAATAQAEPVDDGLHADAELPDQGAQDTPSEAVVQSAVAEEVAEVPVAAVDEVEAQQTTQDSEVELAVATAPDADPILDPQTEAEAAIAEPVSAEPVDAEFEDGPSGLDSGIEADSFADRTTEESAADESAATAAQPIEAEFEEHAVDPAATMAGETREPERLMLIAASTAVSRAAPNPGRSAPFATAASGQGTTSSGAHPAGPSAADYYRTGGAGGAGGNGGGDEPRPYADKSWTLDDIVAAVMVLGILALLVWGLFTRESSKPATPEETDALVQSQSVAALPDPFPEGPVDLTPTSPVEASDGVGGPETLMNEDDSALLAAPATVAAPDVPAAPEIAESPAEAEPATQVAPAACTPGKVVRVLFCTKSTRLTPAMQDRLRGDIAEWKSCAGDREIVVKGYADTRGAEDSNRTLAEGRAESVAAFLRGEGLAVAAPEGVGEAPGLEDGRNCPGQRRADLFLGSDAPPLNRACAPPEELADLVCP